MTVPPAEATPPADSAGDRTTSTGLDPHVAGLLTYAFGWITGLVFFLIEKNHREVRFHAAQSILVSLALIAGFIVLGILSIIPVLGLLFWVLEILLAIASFALWIFLLIQGYRLNHFRLPIVGEIAERWATS